MISFLFVLQSVYIGDTFNQKETVSRKNILYNNLVAGAVAGAISRTFTAPFDRLKTVMQALGSKKDIKIIGGFKHMIEEGGVLGLWRGNGINVVKIAPEVALKFAFFEEVKLEFFCCCLAILWFFNYQINEIYLNLYIKLKHLFRGKDSNREATIGERFVSGSVAGCMAQTAIYPLEVRPTIEHNIALTLLDICFENYCYLF